MDRTGPADGDINRITEKASMAVRLATIGAGAVLAVAAAVWLLVRADYFWQNPLKGARFRLVTDFEGTEQAGAISRDGKFIAFLADQDGPVDVWVTQVGTSQFHNLTRSTIRELTNPSVRTISFSPTQPRCRSGFANPFSEDGSVYSVDMGTVSGHGCSKLTGCVERFVAEQRILDPI